VNLPLPQILRFKGRHAKQNCDLWATALQDRCTREANTLMLKGEISVTISRASHLDIKKGVFETADFR
jgi:hypothetical protein